MLKKDEEEDKKEAVCIYGDHDAQRDYFFPSHFFFPLPESIQDKSAQRVWWFMQRIRHANHSIERIRYFGWHCAFQKVIKWNELRRHMKNAFSNGVWFAMFCLSLLFCHSLCDFGFLAAFLCAIFCSLLFLGTSLFCSVELIFFSFRFGFDFAIFVRLLSISFCVFAVCALQQCNVVKVRHAFWTIQFFLSIRIVCMCCWFFVWLDFLSV